MAPAHGTRDADRSGGREERGSFPVEHASRDKLPIRPCAPDRARCDVTVGDDEPDPGPQYVLRVFASVGFWGVRYE